MAGAISAEGALGALGATASAWLAPVAGAATALWPKEAGRGSDFAAGEGPYQWVVRGGIGKPVDLYNQLKTSEMNGYGLSAQTAPNVDWWELARAGYFKNNMVSVTRAHQLRDVPNFQALNWPTKGRGDHHGTLNFYKFSGDTEKEIGAQGFLMSKEKMDAMKALSKKFIRLPNPYPVIDK